MKKLTPSLLSAAVGMSISLAAEWVEPINHAIDQFGLDANLNRLAMFLTHTGHESGNFKVLSENLNYSAQGLADTWPTRFAAKDSKGNKIKWLVNGKLRYKPNAKANVLHRKPVEIANSVYANRLGNGSESSGDGWRYRGQGLIQLTGKDSYIRCGKALGIDLAARPGLLTEKEFAILSAAWFWQDKDVNKHADKGDVRNATLIINGGTIGLDDRFIRFNKAKGALKGLFA